MTQIPRQEDDVMFSSVPEVSFRLSPRDGWEDAETFGLVRLHAAQSRPGQ